VKNQQKMDPQIEDHDRLIHELNQVLECIMVLYDVVNIEWKKICETLVRKGNPGMTANQHKVTFEIPFWILLFRLHLVTVEQFPLCIQRDPESRGAHPGTLDRHGSAVVALI